MVEQHHQRAAITGGASAQRDRAEDTPDQRGGIGRPQRLGGAPLAWPSQMAIRPRVAAAPYRARPAQAGTAAPCPNSW